MSMCIGGTDLNSLCHMNKKVKRATHTLNYDWQMPLELIKHLCNLKAVSNLLFSVGLIFITE